MKSLILKIAIWHLRLLVKIFEEDLIKILEMTKIIIRIEIIDILEITKKINMVESNSKLHRILEKRLDTKIKTEKFITKILNKTIIESPIQIESLVRSSSM